MIAKQILITAITNSQHSVFPGETKYINHCFAFFFKTSDFKQLSTLCFKKKLNVEKCHCAIRKKEERMRWQNHDAK